MRNQDEDCGYINRFLAHLSFQNGKFENITPSNFEMHDEMLRSYLDCGTVVRIHTKISDFLTWLNSKRYLSSRQYDELMQYVMGCIQSARKAECQRTVERL